VYGQRDAYSVEDQLNCYEVWNVDEMMTTHPNLFCLHGY